MTATTGRSTLFDAFLTELRPLLRAQGAKAAYLFGSWARGDSRPEAERWLRQAENDLGRSQAVSAISHAESFVAFAVSEVREDR